MSPSTPSTQSGPRFNVGSLVRARGREWVVLPDSNEELLLLRPLGGTEDETTGILTALEEVTPAHFPLPDPNEVGDYRSGRLLRDALRLSVRWCAGPFRSFGRIAVEPRPYQLVPLLMALRLDPVRMLIADDVGIGKTIEACLIARELIDRGECRRLTVLCPPHLAEQWKRELDEKFHVETALVLAGSVPRLERNCRLGQSLFERYPRTVVSIDYIKSDRRRDEFIRNCAELVIVDEAHTCSFDDVHNRGRHQRHELVKALAADPNRHMIFVTATPHSGKEAAFRSLLAFLNPSFAELPEDLTGPENAKQRRQVAAHFVQRRRADIRHYMQDETEFPEREDAEAHYKLSPAYRQFLDRVLAYARESVLDDSGGRHRQRVRWWSALGLLRALASSPAAAALALRNRSPAADADSAAEVDEIGRSQVLDLQDSDAADALDVIPGVDPGDGEASASPQDVVAAAEGAGELQAVAERAPGKGRDPHRRRLLDLARAADALRGKEDQKLQDAGKLIEALLKDGYHPIVFCRFIQTAEYVAEELRKRLKKVEVAAVTGDLPPAERESRVEELGQHKQRVLVCTDCLSEGINLQHSFNAVFHYDLTWNPTRHEQREGRVDRYGQASDKVRALTFYGIDNAIDGLVLDVLLRKHLKIRSSLGISVPVPVDTNAVVEAIFEGLLMRSKGKADQTSFEFARKDREHLHARWDNVSAREKRSRTVFAQEGIKVDEVARELGAARAAVGSGTDVARFARDAVALHQGHVEQTNGSLAFDLREAPDFLRELFRGQEQFVARFKLPVDPGEVYLSRTHPWIDGLAEFVINGALDALTETRARRCGAIYTRDVKRKTTLLLLRLRYHLQERNGDLKELLAEEAQVTAFANGGGTLDWLARDEIDALLQAKPHGNLNPEEQAEYVGAVIERYEELRPTLDELAHKRAEELLDAHRRVRAAARGGKRVQAVAPELPGDVLGVYVFLPKA